MTNEKNCIMGDGICNLAGTKECNKICPSFIQLHGTSGVGGRIGMANVPRQYRLLTIANSTVRELQEENYKVIDKYIARLFNPRNLKDEQLSLYLYSKNPGTGKSTSSAAILNSYIIKSYLKHIKEGGEFPQRIAYFLDTNEWQTLYNQATRQNVPKDVAEEAWTKYYKMLEIAKEIPFLVCDDVAVRSITEGHRGDLHSLINHRVSEAMPTVYTSNIPINGLPSVFGEERLFDRLRDMTLQLDFEGTSQRGMRK